MAVDATLGLFGMYQLTHAFTLGAFIQNNTPTEPETEENSEENSEEEKAESYPSSGIIAEAKIAGLVLESVFSISKTILLTSQADVIGIDNYLGYSFGKVDVGLRIRYISVSFDTEALSITATNMQYGVGANMSL